MTADPLNSLAEQVLLSANMQEVSFSHSVALSHIFEDAYAVVGVAEYESILELTNGWLDAQEELLNAMSASVTSIGAKAWDGYLVLICPQTPLGDQVAQLSEIRFNTRRTRKLILVEDSALHLADDTHPRLRRIRRELAPLLPLEVPGVNSFVDPLDELPNRLQVPGFEVQDLRRLVSSYEGREPLMAVMHESLEEKRS